MNKPDTKIKIDNDSMLESSILGMPPNHISDQEVVFLDYRPQKQLFEDSAKKFLSRID